MKVILVASLKGGAAKTTSALNLAAGLVELGATVRLADCDPSATSLLSYVAALPGVMFVKTGALDIAQHVTTTADFLIIDAPPNPQPRELGALIRCADHVIVPCPPARHAVDAALAIAGPVRDCRERFKTRRPALHYLVTINRRNATADGERARLAKAHEKRILRAVVPYSAHFEAAASNGATIMQQAPRSHGARAYRALAKEVGGW